MKLAVATCQFPVSSDIRRNLRYVLRQMRTARERGAHVAHFCEGSLSGYAGADFASHRRFDWDRLRACAEAVLGLARELRLWVLLGSSHRLSGDHKPHNSVYVIDDRGTIVDRYDKRFCAGDPSGRSGDLAHYSPGDHPSVFSIRGIRCGVLICHEYRYPERERPAEAAGVDASPGRRFAPRAQPGDDAPRDHDARVDDHGGGEQPRLDQLQQHLREAELLAGLLRAPGWRDHRSPAHQYRGRPRLDREHA
jgi:hypothetical protein